MMFLLCMNIVRVLFKSFFAKMNTLDSHINFTFERSSTGTDIGLPSEVLEVLAFLDLKVV